MSKRPAHPGDGPRCRARVQRRPRGLAQLFQWTPEQLIKYTGKNPYERFADGRPKVPDEMLERLKGLIAEEVQAVLPARGFPNQFEPREGWKVLQPKQKMVGRVFTVQFMPARGDIIEIDEADAKAKGTAPARNQTAIDMLQPGDVIVADVFGAEWNFVGNKLAHYIQTTTKNGMIVDGGVYWLERIADTGMQAYYKNSLPTQDMRVMVTGINIPVRIGKTLVMPGDVVLADREGLWFIPPHMVKEVVESGEVSKARDDWSLMMLGTGKYTSRQNLRPADAGAAEAARRLRLQEDRPPAATGKIVASSVGAQSRPRDRAPALFEALGDSRQREREREVDERDERPDGQRGGVAARELLTRPRELGQADHRTSDESFSSAMPSLVSGGTTRRKVCGRMMRRIACQ